MIGIILLAVIVLVVMILLIFSPSHAGVFFVVALIFSAAYRLISDRIRIVYTKYDILDKKLVLHSKKTSLIIKYYDISDLWIDKKTNEITVNVNTKIKETGIYDSKFTEEYALKCGLKDSNTDINKLMKLSKLNFNMTKEDSDKRAKEIADLFKSGRINEF